MCTAAHEFGHSVLYATTGIRTSGTHKGTSTLLTQAVRKDAPTIPQQGEIDLMKYYNSFIHKSMYERIVAAEGRLESTSIKSSGVQLLIGLSINLRGYDP